MEDLQSLLLRFGDDRLVLGHRLSEWCGHAHELEDDIALTNIALDLIGQAEILLARAGELEGKGRDADRFAFFREAIEYQNCLLVELPRGDFGATICRQFLFDCYSVILLNEMRSSGDDWLRGVSERFLKEERYHLRYSRGWFVRLGDGTEESKARMQAHLDGMWRYTGELWDVDELTRRLIETGVLPELSGLQAKWRVEVEDGCREAGLAVPTDGVMQLGGRQGRHTEHLGRLLAEMQILPRSYPGGVW